MCHPPFTFPKNFIPLEKTQFVSKLRVIIPYIPNSQYNKIKTQTKIKANTRMNSSFTSESVSKHSFFVVLFSQLPIHSLKIKHLN